MNVARLLLRTASVFPERTAIMLGEKQQLNYRELGRRAASIAASLKSDPGLSPGHRVALFMSNDVAYLEILYGIWWAGLVAVPINAKLHPKEAAYILENAGAACLFCSDDLAAGIEPIADTLPALRRVYVAGSDDYARLQRATPAPLTPRAPDDVAWLFYTSGTTGFPKGVMQTHCNLLTMTSCYFTDVDDVAPGDAMVYAAPFSHGAGLYHFPYLLLGAMHVIPESRGFEPEELCRLSKSIGQLTLFAAPTMVKRLVEHIDTHSASPTGFKTIIYGGGPMYTEDIRKALSVMGNRFVQIYGQGECPMTITALSREHLADTTHPRWLERIASVGIAQSMVEVITTDDQGVALPPGEIGEIRVRGDVVMAGYWNNPEASAAALQDGWLRTGDVGRMDEDGFLTLHDRSKDLIISGGANIYPREVEEVLLRHPDVHEVSVIGKPDAEWGEVVVAFVVAKQVTVAELDALCLAHIARFKRPKHYHFIDALPKNNYGKVLKTALREQLARYNPPSDLETPEKS
jgi:long-chain acyl-CoA synthetase